MDPKLPEDTTLILDKRTYQLLGTRERDSHGFVDESGRFGVETELMITATMRTAVVDEYGDRP
ncbi:hypothetical protein ACQP1W_40075 [Spirillospora sp. CA-255316]